MKIALLGVAASPFIYQHIQQSLIQRKIENRAAFIQALDRTPLEAEIPKAMVSLGRLDHDDKIRLFHRFGVEDFYVHVRRSPLTVQSGFEVVSIAQASNCRHQSTDQDTSQSELWQISEDKDICLIVSRQGIDRRNLPADALYFMQGDATSFSEGIIGRTKFGPLGGSRQFELRNGRNGPLIEYFETATEAKAEVFLKTHYSNAVGTPRTWRFLQRAIDPAENYGGHTKGRHILRPFKLKS